MLTKQDLLAIRKIVREEIENEIQNAKSEIMTEIKLSRMRVQNDIDILTDRIKNVEILLRKNTDEDDLFESL